MMDKLKELLKNRGVLSTIFAVVGVIGGVLGKDSVSAPVFKVEVTNWPVTVPQSNDGVSEEEHEKKVKTLREQIDALRKVLEESRKSK